MTQPLSRALQRYKGSYETLFQPGQILNKHAKKGWVIARIQVSAKNHAEFFDRLIATLSLEPFDRVGNPEGLIQRINICIQRPPIPTSLPATILFKSSCKTFGFLSNFFPSLVSFNERLFRSSEHLYQWRVVVSIDPDNADSHFMEIYNLDPLKARKYSHEIQAKIGTLVEQGAKLGIMEEVAYLKFSQNPPLRDALVATHPVRLVENTESTFWGGDTNYMGKILEATREQFIPSQHSVDQEAKTSN